MNAPSERHHYDAIFNDGSIMDGAVRCPACERSTIHPSSTARPIESPDEYGPAVGVTAWCECGASLEIRLGSYKGHFGIDVAATDQ